MQDLGYGYVMNGGGIDTLIEAGIETSTFDPSDPTP